MSNLAFHDAACPPVPESALRAHTPTAAMQAGAPSIRQRTAICGAADQTQSLLDSQSAQHRKAVIGSAAVVFISCAFALVYEVLIWQRSHTLDAVYLFNFAAGLVTSAIAFALSTHGHPKVGVAVMGILLVMLAVNATLMSGLGLRAPVMVMIAALILGSNFSYGPKVGRWVLLLSCAYLAILLGLEESGLITGMTPSRYPPAINTFMTLMCVYVCSFAFSHGFQQRSDMALNAVAKQNAELQLALVERERALADREAALADKARAQAAKDRFLATMSHEIRTPMAGIRTAITLLQNPKVNDAARTRYLAALDTTTESLLRLLNDLLDTSQLEAGALNVQLRPLELDRLVSDTVALFELAAREKNLTMFQEVHHDTDAMVEGDPARLRQMLSNLLGNAIKFTQTGHICVEVLPATTTADNDLWAFRVTDTGPGISEADQQRLFLPFSQLEQSDHLHHGGSGLGLSIVRRLAQAMGGDAGVISQPGEGSTFWFTARLARVRSAETNTVSA